MKIPTDLTKAEKKKKKVVSLIHNQAKDGKL